MKNWFGNEDSSDESNEESTEDEDEGTAEYNWGKLIGKIRI